MVTTYDSNNRLRISSQGPVAHLLKHSSSQPNIKTI